MVADIVSGAQYECCAMPYVSVSLFGLCVRFVLNIFVKNRLCSHGMVVNPRISCLPFLVSHVG